ncbi:MAG: RNA polymerase sigma factor [Phycisphaerales bacterium]
MGDALLAIPVVEARGTASAEPGERALIDQARTDPGAYSRLYRRHYRTVAGYLYRRIGDEHAAEDLASETFIAAWQALPRYRHTGAPFSAWLLRIATNKANAWARSNRRRGATLPPPTMDDAEAPAAREELDLLYLALRALSPDHQSVIALVHFESMSMAHAAAVLGVREGTVKSRLSRARDALRVEVERLGGGS